MHTIILAGGKGNRALPISTNIPKTMVKIHGKPLINHLFENIATTGLTSFIIVLGEKGEKIKEWIANNNNFGYKIKYTIQKEAEGMANALLTTENFMIKENNFLLVNSSDVFDENLIENMLNKLKESKADIILSYKSVVDTWNYGIIELDNDKVKKIIEKPQKGEEPSNLAVLGVYILSTKIYNYIRNTIKSDTQFEDAIQKFINEGGDVRAIEHKGFFHPFKYPWDLFEVSKYLFNKVKHKNIKKIKTYTGVVHQGIISLGKNVEIKKGVYLDGENGPILIGDNVKIFEGAIIRGPCYVGNGSFLGNNILLRGHVSIGENCVIGFSTEIKNALIGDGCKFHTNYVGDSIIGNECLFGSGAITANYLFNETEIKVNIEKNNIKYKVPSGRIKLGLIAGNKCKLGVNSTTMPGIKIGPNSRVGPNVCLYKDLQPNESIFIDKNITYSRR